MPDKPIYLIAIGFFTLGIAIGSSFQPVEKIDNFLLDGKIVETIKNRDKLPYGYKMETNGKEFAYVTSNGTRSIFSEPSLEEAIEAAWNYYEYEDRKKTESWKPIEINKHQPSRN